MPGQGPCPASRPAPKSIMTTSSSPRVLVFQHMEKEDPGLFKGLMDKHGLAWTTVHLHAGEAVPALEAFDFLLVMGGIQDVWQEARYPWLAQEKAAIRRWVGELDKPYLGICLGHQLLADALGGEVGRATTGEIGFHGIELNAEGRKSPLFAGMPASTTWMQWHGAEVKALPVGATSLGHSPACAVQAMQVGSHAFGLQFHAEASAESMAAWRSLPDYLPAIEKGLGIGADLRLSQEIDVRLPSVNRTAIQLFDNVVRAAGLIR